MRGIIETSLPSFAEDALGIVEVILDVDQHQGGPGGIQLNIVAQPKSLGSDGGRNQPVTSLFQRQLSGLERPIRGYHANPVAVSSPPTVCDGNVGEDEARELTHVSGRPFLLAAFAKVRAMYDAGKSVAAISRELRLTRKVVDKWVRLDSLPERARIAPRSSTPSKFVTYLRDRWTLGETNVRRLPQEVREQGYTGCYSRLAAFVAPWRQKAERQPTPPSPIGLLPLDPRTGGVISPIIAAALCIKPRGLHRWVHRERTPRAPRVSL